MRYKKYQSSNKLIISHSYYWAPQTSFPTVFHLNISTLGQFLYFVCLCFWVCHSTKLLQLNKHLEVFLMRNLFGSVGFPSVTLYCYYLIWAHYKLRVLKVFIEWNFTVLNFVVHHQEQHEQTCLKVIDMSQTAGSGKQERGYWGHTDPLRLQL